MSGDTSLSRRPAPRRSIRNVKLFAHFPTATAHFLFLTAKYNLLPHDIEKPVENFALVAQLMLNRCFIFGTCFLVYSLIDLRKSRKRQSYYQYDIKSASVARTITLLRRLTYTPVNRVSRNSSEISGRGTKRLTSMLTFQCIRVVAAFPLTLTSSPVSRNVPFQVCV